MPIKFHEKKRLFIDSKGFELVAEIQTKPLIKASTPSDFSTSYLRHKHIFDLGEILGPLTTSRKDLAGNLVEKFTEFKNEKLGFEHSGFKKIYQLAENILKDTEISSCISAEFVVDLIFDWAIETKRHTQQSSLSAYLITNFENSVQPYNIYIPILYLESDREFIIGRVRFLYLTEQYIATLAEKVDENKRVDFFEGMKMFTGQLMANCSVTTEKNKGIELAKEQVTLSVDALRVLSPTVEYPNFKIYFDADYRNIHQLKSEILVQSPHKPEELAINHTRGSEPFVINPQTWHILTQQGLSLVHQFINRTTNKRTELEALIHNAIRNFAKAIATHDLHERVVVIYSVLESLLLPDESASILNSVDRYLPRFISKDVEMRKKVIETVKELYKVRSSMIHHAKKRDFKLEDLSFLQICTRSVILQFIQKSIEKTSKKDILKEIDDIILSA